MDYAHRSFSKDSPFYKSNRIIAFKPSQKDQNKAKQTALLAIWASVLAHTILLFLLVYIPVSKPELKKPITITLEDWKQEVDPIEDLKTTEIDLTKKDSGLMSESASDNRSKKLPIESNIKKNTKIEQKPLPKLEPKTIVPPITNSIVTPSSDRKEESRVIAPSTKEIIVEEPKEADFKGSEWEFLNNNDKITPSTGIIGDTLLSLSSASRSFNVEPNFTFIEGKNFSAWVNKVNIELEVASNGAVIAVKVLPPGSMDANLDKELIIAFSKAFLNDSSVYSKANEKVLVTLKFRE